MEKVIVEQFNPANGYWNTLYEIDKKDFNPNEPIKVDKYGGPYRNRTVGSVNTEKAVIDEPIKKKKVVREPKVTTKRKVLYTFDDNLD
jgi:hypothetical protein